MPRSLCSHTLIHQIMPPYRIDANFDRPYPQARAHQYLLFRHSHWNVSVDNVSHVTTFPRRRIGQGVHQQQDGMHGGTFAVHRIHVPESLRDAIAWARREGVSR
jgi:hypothetical protein